MIGSLRARAGSARRELRFAWSLRELPPPVRRFAWRARRHAVRVGDEFGIASSTGVEKLAALLAIAGGRRYVVELGTAVGWTSIALLLADPQREVLSFDVYRQPLLDDYLWRAGASIGGRLELRREPGETGPLSDRAVDLLYIDSDHERESTVREFRAWEPVLRRGSVVVFDDYTHPDYPGVREAVAALGLAGEERAGYFIHRVPDGS